MQSNFKIDIIRLIIATIVVGALLSLVVGYISDFYFGNLVSNLIGGYGEYDLLLVVDQQQQQQAKQELQQIINDKLAGSKLMTGVSLVGRTNFFIKLAPEYKTRSTLLKIKDYFTPVTGLENVSLIIQPRITIRGLKKKANSYLEPQINSLPGVDYTLPQEDKLEVVVTTPERLAEVKEKITTILEKNQVLSVRFPIASEPERIVELGEQVTTQLQQEFTSDIVNITATGREDLEALLKTMTEMKQFLASYTSRITIQVKPQIELAVEDKLVVPSQQGGQVQLRVTAVDDDQAQAIVTDGDSRAILGDQAYQPQAEQLGPAVGNIEVHNPRQQLAYATNQLVKLMPNLQSIFQQSEELLGQLVELSSLLQQARESLVQIKLLNQQLTTYQQDISEVEFTQLQQAVADLEQNLAWLAEVAQALDVIQGVLTDLNSQLESINRQLEQASQQLAPGTPYYQQVQNLRQTIGQLATSLEENSSPLIAYINRYNPVLQEVTAWREQVSQLRGLLATADTIEELDLEARLKEVINPQLIEKVNNLDTATLKTDLNQLETRIEQLRSVDFPAIINELQSIQQSLPQLKDEEITATIDLIDEYLAGKVIPGSEIGLILPAQGIDLDQVKRKIQALIPHQVSFTSAQLGIISPNYRAQVYQILSEIKMILAALTAILITLFSLLFDHTVVINSLRLWQGARSWYADFGLYYGVLVGGGMLGAIFGLASIDLPYIAWWQVVLFGMSLGFFTVYKASSLNPITVTEFQAGRALGLSYAEIMRQIIIPAGKPGLLQFFNRSKTYF